MNSAFQFCRTVKVLLRCDSSIHIGTGHVIRCRTLARALRLYGAEVIFICRNLQGNIASLLNDEFELLILPAFEEPYNKTESSIRSTDDFSYSHWLGCTQEFDALETLSLIKSRNIDKVNYLIVDHYAIDSLWERIVLEDLILNESPNIKLVVIDDLANRSHVSDALIDQNIPIHPLIENRYKEFCPQSSQFFFGPSYSLLSSEYADLHLISPLRTHLSRVLVSFGGIDLNDYTSQVLHTLSSPEFMHLHVDVVLGQHCPHIDTVNDLLVSRGNSTLHIGLPSMAALILRSDLAIGACGSSVWERLCLGLPSISIPIAENQFIVADVLSKYQYSEVLLPEDKDSLFDSLRRSLLNKIKSFSSIISARDNFFVDGFGAHRLALALTRNASNFFLRKATYLDESLLLYWANDPVVRSNSLNSQPISPESHSLWFKECLADPNCQQFIAINNHGLPLGQIRFDKSPSTPDIRVSLSLDECARGLGLGKTLIRFGIQKILLSWRRPFNLNAEILDTNEPSASCFKSLGFTLVAGDTTSTYKVWQLRMM